MIVGATEARSRHSVQPDETETTSVSSTPLASHITLISQASIPATQAALKTPSVKSEKLATLYEEGKQGCINSYLAYAEQLFANQVQPDRRLRHLDQVHLPAMVDAFNRIYPGLNLHYGNGDQLQALIINNQEGNHRFRFLKKQMPRHYSFFDICIRNESPVRIIGIAPSDMSNANFICSDLPIPCQSFDYEINAQKSPEDCTIFSLDFAIQCHLNESEFDLTMDDIITSNFKEKNSYNTCKIKNSWTTLPADFYIHTQARSTLKDTILEHKYVESIKMTLSEWQEKHLRPMKTSLSQIDVMKYYNSSIEARRIELIKMIL